MAEVLIDGRGNWIAGGSKYVVGVTEDNKLMVDAAVSVGSITAQTGSTAYLFGKSGAGYYPLLSTSGTDGGLLRVDSSVSVSTGSESYIKGGSILTYNPIGIGSVLVTNPAVVGSYTTQTVVGSFAITNFGVQGSSVVVTNAVTVGSLATQMISGTVAISTSPLPISGIVNQGTSPWIIAGSISSMPTISVSTGSEQYIKGGSILTYNPIGIGSVLITHRVAGSIVNLPGVDINSPATIGSYATQTIIGSVAISSPISVSTGSTSYIFGKSGADYYPLLSTSGTDGGVLRVDSQVSVTTGSVVYQGTDPWIVLGSVAVSSPISVTAGSESYIKGGSILTYSGTNYTNVVQQTTPWTVSGIVNLGTQAGNITTLLGSTSIYNRVGGSIVNLPVGSNFTLSSPGSIGVYGTLFPVSGIVNQGTNPWIVLGSVAVSSPISVTTGSEIFNRVAGSIVNWPGSLAITNFNALGSSVIVTNFGTIGSSRVTVNNLTLSTGSVNASSGTSQMIISGATGSFINLYAYKLVVGSTASLAWQNGTGAIEGAQFYAANGGVVESVNPPYYLLRTTAGSNLSLSTTGSVAGRISYFWSIT